MTLPRTICFGFLTVILVGALLLTMPFATSNGSWGSFITALFTSTSAVCVTGLAVEDTGTYFSFWGQLIIALLVQIGGLGYMTTSTFLMLLIGKRVNFHQKLAIQDSFDRPFLQGSKNLIISVIATTLIFEITAVFFLTYRFAQDMNLGKALWWGIFHSISAWNNAGFGLLKDNLMSYHADLIINLVITGLIIFGGIGYQVIIEAYFWFSTRNREKFVFSLNFKVVITTTLVLLVLGTIGILATEFHNPNTLAGFSLQDKVLAAWFQSVTTRTAGFNSIDNGKMTTAALLITMGLMFIGASPSGTGGGIKTTTLRIITNCTKSVLKGEEQVILYKREVPVSLVLKATGVVFGSAMTVIVSTLLVSLVEHNFTSIQILFEVISAFATVGLSMGITSGLSVVSKLVIIATMYIGRVGILLLITALIGDVKPRIIQYPEETLLVG